MRLLLVLSTAFTSLAGYLEHTAPLANSRANQVEYHAAPLSVVRTTPPAPTKTQQIAAASAPRPASPIKPPVRQLNLQVPVEPAHHMLDTSKPSTLDLFAPLNQGKVTYNAELVFDRETGEDVTGGKLNIRIPLT